MHRCLEVAEIVQQFIQFAEDDARKVWWEARPPPSLVLAQTCRAFYEPACNVHWSRMDSFQPLLDLFPSARTQLQGKSKGRRGKKRTQKCPEDPMLLQVRAVLSVLWRIRSFL